MERPIRGWYLRVVRAFAEVLFDDGTGVPPERLDWVAREYGAFAAHVGAKTRTGFKAAIFAIQFFPVFFVGIPLPMTMLSMAQRRRYLERLERSTWTFLVTAVKIVLCTRYFEHPDVVPTLGFDGRPMLVTPDDAPHPALARKAGLPVLPSPNRKAAS